MVMTTLLKVALAGTGLIGFGYLVLQGVARFGINDMVPPLVTTRTCGPDELRLTHTRQSDWGNALTTLQLHFNGRLVDMRGQGWVLGRFSKAPTPGGSGLRFYPAALRADALPQEHIAPLDSAAFEYVIWVSPKQFTQAEFARLAACCRVHTDIINRALDVGDITFLNGGTLADHVIEAPRGVLTRLVYGEVEKYRTADLTYQSPTENGAGGHDVLTLDDYGTVGLTRPDYGGANVNDELGRRQPGTDTLALVLHGPKAELLTLNGRGPLPTLAALARFRDKQGRELGTAFKLTETPGNPAP